MEATAREMPQAATSRPPFRPLGMLDRFVLTELLPPFLFGILAFLSLLVGIDMLFDMLKLMVREQFSWGEIGLVFAYGLPTRIVWTLPMAVLLACLYTFNRLSGDGEIVALQAGGIGFLRIHAPAIAFALVVSFFTYWLNDQVVPASNVRAKEVTLAHRTRGVVKEHVVFFMPEEVLHAATL
jgi:lipopolysaccharide export system permease protein